MNLTDKAIIIHYNPFDTFSKITLLDKKSVEGSMYIHSLMQHGANELVDVCYSKNIFNVFFDGPIEFLPELRNLTFQLENDKYSFHKIKIEGVY